MPIATRLTNTGTLLVNGSFDEFTGAPVVNGNLVLWLDAGQSTSYSGTGNTWTDLSTTGLNGTLVNSPTFSSSPANIRFNGTTQRVTFSSSSAVQFLNRAPYTLEVWVYPTQLPAAASYQCLIDREGDPGTGRDGWNLWLYGDPASPTNMLLGAERFGLGVNYGGVFASVSSASTLTTWQHVVATYDGTTQILYRNGVQLGSNTSTGNITNTTQTVGIAKGGSLSFLYASVSCAKVYNRALTSAEILQNYNALVGRYGLTANTSGTAIQRTTSNTVLAEQFDEVTISGGAVPQRQLSNGTLQVSSIFDEFTGASVVNTNLKLWIDAGQTSSYSGSGTTWTDLSGTSNNLTLTNSPTFNGKLGGGAITFDGSTSYAVKTVASGIPSGASPFTLSTWFYPTSSAAAMRVVSYGTENTGQLVSIRINAGGAYAVTFGHWGGAGYDVGNGSTVNGNAWNNVTEVFDGTNDYMYINGTLVGTFTPSTLNISASPDFYVGKRATGEAFAGSVGQTMLYNRALTADEVTSNFNALRNRYGI
jgi:hypothetical protein